MSSDTRNNRVIDATPERADEDVSPEKDRSGGAVLTRVLLAITLIALVTVAAALYYAYDYWQDARQELMEVNGRLTTAKTAQAELLRAIDDTRRLLDGQQGELERQEQALQRQTAAIAGQESEIRAQQQSFERERRSLEERQARRP